MNKPELTLISVLALGGIAAAQTAAKAPAPPAAKPAVSPNTPTVADKAAPPKATEMPRPAPELIDFAKQMAGMWKCKGSAEFGGTMMDVKVTMTNKPDLNNFWVQSSLTINAGKLTFKSLSYVTYDPEMKKLYRVNMTGSGGHGTAWGTTTDNKKISWEGDARWHGKDMKVRQTEELTSPKELKVLGEYSDDGGKTWKKDHEGSCKK